MTQSDSSVDEMNVDEAYRFLQDNPAAQLVDVRTRAEWTFVGAPLLPFREDGAIMLEWQSYPDMRIDADFVARLDAELARRRVGADAALLFLCRSGARSHAAALAMKAAGRARCVNVRDGFEGPLDAEGRRGRVAGWRAAGLPWRQS
ncbi:MAG: rhodanese-like domain-containing protein [Rhodoblastus sp.]|nr:MAG: rhodanese-like domain-containing protein [Rhodoblastus sp.]